MMTQVGSMTANGEIGSRLARLRLVLVLTVGLLLSLLHCTGCGLSFASFQFGGCGDEHQFGFCA